MEAKRKKTAKATEKTKQVLNKRTSKSSSAKRPASPSKNKNSISKDTRSERLFREKLGSLSTAIDSIQNEIKSIGIDKVQDMFRTIFDDITFFLKSLPEIKKSELLTDYNKAYNKFDRLIKSITFNFDSTKIFPSDNLTKNTELDENNILIEKVKDNVTIYYRIKYINKGTLISIFSEDGHTARHYKIKLDGNQEAKAIICNSNGLVTELVNNIYDENKFTVIDTVIVNKDIYGYFLGNNFDTVKDRNITLVSRHYTNCG